MTTLSKPTSDETFRAARKAMIDSQLRTSGVNEEYVLARLNSVRREDFVPDDQKSIAYMDRAIPLGNGNFLASPLVHAKMLAEAVPTAGDTVLIVSAAPEYLTALVKPLVDRIDTISPDDANPTRSGKTKPYSLILIDGAVEQVPETLIKRLADGGRMVTGLVERGVTRLATGRKAHSAFALQSIADIGIPVLHALDKPKSWSFT